MWHNFCEQNIFAKNKKNENEKNTKNLKKL